MGFVEWFKNTTFQGKITRDLGKVTLQKGVMSVRLEVQELEPKKSERRFRLNLVAKSPLSWQSMPLVLTEPQMVELGDLIKSALAHIPSSEPLRPTSWGPAA